MSVQTVDISKLVVTQSNDLARAKYSMSLQEQRLVLILIAMVRQDHDEFYRYRIPIADLPQIFGVPSNHIYGIAKEVCEKLMSRVVRKEVKGGWDMFQWLFRAKYREHMEEFNGAGIELQIHEDMRPYLLELKKRFASLPLYHLAHLPSFHDIHLFLILWHESHSLARTKFYIALDDLKTRLDVEDNYYNFNDFKRRILEKAQKDFAKLTPMRFDWKTETRGRKVIGLHFTVSANEQPYQLGFELPQWLRYARTASPCRTRRGQKRNIRVARTAG